jgi:hypothetical protein
MEDRGWRIEDGGSRMEDRGWRIGNGGLRMEVGVDSEPAPTSVTIISC